MKFELYKESLTATTENVTKTLVKLNCLLASLNRSHHYSDSLQLFRQIHSSHHLRPDHYTLSAALTASANHRNTVVGAQLHAHATRAGLKSYLHVANMLLSLYAKSKHLVSVKRVFSEIENPDVYSRTALLSASSKLGQVGYSRGMFDQLSQRSVVVWNAIISGCSKNGYAKIASDLFRRMHTLGVRHDNYTFASVLSLCSPELLGSGRRIHSLVFKTGFLGRASVINAQLTMYFSCGCVSDAFEVFEEAEGAVHDQITYNAMIADLVSVGRDKEALIMFVEMQTL